MADPKPIVHALPDLYGSKRDRDVAEFRHARQVTREPASYVPLRMPTRPAMIADKTAALAAVDRVRRGTREDGDQAIAMAFGAWRKACAEVHQKNIGRRSAVVFAVETLERLYDENPQALELVDLLEKARKILLKW